MGDIVEIDLEVGEVAKVAEVAETPEVAEVDEVAEDLDTVADTTYSNIRMSNWYKGGYSQHKHRSQTRKDEDLLRSSLSYCSSKRYGVIKDLKAMINSSKSDKEVSGPILSGLPEGPKRLETFEDIPIHVPNMNWSLVSVSILPEVPQLCDFGTQYIWRGIEDTNMTYWSNIKGEYYFLSNALSGVFIIARFEKINNGEQKGYCYIIKYVEKQMTLVPPELPENISNVLSDFSTTDELENFIRDQVDFLLG